MEPINYLAALPQVNPLQQLAQGLQIGGAIAQNRQQQQAQQRQSQFQARVQSLFANSGASARDYMELGVQYPEFAQQAESLWKGLSEQRKADDLRRGYQVMARIQAGDPAGAEQMIRDHAEQLKAAGAPESEWKAELEDADLIRANPQQALATGALLFSQVDPKFPEVWEKLRSVTRAEELQPAAKTKAEAEASEKQVEAKYAERKALAEIRNYNSQIADRAGRLNLDAQRLALDTEKAIQEAKRAAGTLTPGVEKIVNESIPAALASEQSADQLEGLATKLQGVKSFGTGIFASASEGFAKALGGQDQLSALRQEYTRLRNQQAIKSLPPGPATDRDIELALKGFPPENASPQYIASFLNGTAKLQRIDALAQKAKAEWAQANGSLGNARGTGEVKGVPVTAGMSFPEFTAAYLEKYAPKPPEPPASPAPAGNRNVVVDY